ncbi:MAG: hypothetical protein N3G21_00010 [Candidatus Hydrogenedentes bacterium]|nr:hypothetical protein [Candidatus Hydrogenedentota bacterium]
MGYKGGGELSPVACICKAPGKVGLEGEGGGEGVVEEGIVEGVMEGEGLAEGVSEGMHEGGREGSVEGMREGYGEGAKEGEDGGFEFRLLCGCLDGKAMYAGDWWWRYLLDIVVLGMLVMLMSGMRREKR